MMSSQEEYLDRLLKNLGAGNMDLQEPVKAEETVKPNRVFVDDSFSEQEEVTEDIAEQLSERNVSELIEALTEAEKNASEEAMDATALLMDDDDDLDMDMGFMSEADVENALNAAMEPEDEGIATEGSELYGMLDIDSSIDSDPIKDLLEKGDKNLAVDAGILELLQGGPEEEPDLFGESNETAEDNTAVTDDVAAQRMNMAEKKALKEAKAARKKERRDAIRQERAARKEAKRDAKRKTVPLEESDGTVLPHVDLNAVQYNDLNGAENYTKETSATDIGALYGMATVDMDAIQEVMPADMGLTAGNVTMGMEAVSFADDTDISAIQGIELTDLGLTGVDFMNLQEVQMNDADATADALFKQLSEDGMLSDVFGMSGEAEIVQGAPDNIDSKQRKSKKGNKSGKGFFARFMDMITEEEEEETESKGNENLSISDENKAILDELDAMPEKKKKKGKTPEELEEIKRKKEEKRKAKAEKKEKKQEKKQETMPIRQKPLSRKKVGAVAILGVSAVVIIVIISAIMIEYISKREARQAYYDQDYEVCYQNLFGKDLNESEQIMFHRSEIILKMRLWLREYEILAQEGSEMEALDSLIQSVHEYPALFEYSNKWNAGPDVQAIYDQLVSILNRKYHLTEKEAEEIALIKEDVEYTRAVKAITEGMTYSDWKSQGGNGNNVSQSKDDTDNDDELPMIPGEDDESNTQFIDNM